MKHELAPLPYAYDALEPYIDAQTMAVHHDKHHQTYTDKMNAVLEKYPAITKQPEEIMADLPNSGLSSDDQLTFKNHGGGFINHNFFWSVMDPTKQVDQTLVEQINQTFGSVDEFKKVFKQG